MPSAIRRKRNFIKFWIPPTAGACAYCFAHEHYYTDNGLGVAAGVFVAVWTVVSIVVIAARMEDS